ncbi:thioesterase family protein [Leifsonia sp. NPDC058292]|uniref:thioesterase family protein n=1 Tax=Leifsonia sp. NPDC058292 TaxID=3346428 RepID=UPI0036D90F12
MAENNSTTPQGAYFVALGGNRYEPTERAGGAWSPDEIHFAPLGGLITHAIEQHVAAAEESGRRGDGLQVARISFDILGFLAAQPIDIAVETVRPGRSIELVEATATIAGRAAVRARAWFLDSFDTRSVAGGQGEPLPGPESAVSLPLRTVWSGGFVASLDARAAGASEPGRGTVWLATETALVAGEEASPLASWIGLIDTANGVAVRQSPAEWMFPNVDLTVHLHRRPAGRWIGLDTTVVFGAQGHGLTSSVLHDETGPVGVAQQALTIRPLSPEH